MSFPNFMKIRPAVLDLFLQTDDTGGDAICRRGGSWELTIVEYHHPITQFRASVTFVLPSVGN
jgi:hypothetical protein